MEASFHIGHAALLLIATLTAGCAEQLPSPAVISKLRLLAITAEAPEVAPGTDVHLRAIWFDGSPEAPREVHYLWRLCPEGADREPRACLSPSRGIDLAAGAVRSGDGDLALTIPASRLALAPGESAATWFVLLVMCPTLPPVFEASLGHFVCPSEADVPNERREGIQAVRRLTVRDGSDPAQPPLNHNPVIARVRVGGVDVPEGGRATVFACPALDAGVMCAGTPLALYAAEGSIERRVDGAPETLLVSFFTTAGGSFDRPRAVASEGHPLGEDGSLGATYYPPSRSGPARLWLVLRDGRGGDAVRSIELDVR